MSLMISIGMYLGSSNTNGSAAQVAVTQSLLWFLNNYGGGGGGGTRNEWITPFLFMNDYT